MVERAQTLRPNGRLAMPVKDRPSSPPLIPVENRPAHSNLLTHPLIHSHSNIRPPKSPTPDEGSYLEVIDPQYITMLDTTPDRGHSPPLAPRTPELSNEDTTTTEARPRKRIRKHTAAAHGATGAPLVQQILHFSYFQAAAQSPTTTSVVDDIFHDDDDGADSVVESDPRQQRRTHTQVVSNRSEPWNVPPPLPPPPSPLLPPLPQPQQKPSARTKLNRIYDYQPPALLTRSGLDKLVSPGGGVELTVEALMVPTYFVMRKHCGASFEKEPPRTTPGFSVDYWWAEQNMAIVLCSDELSEEHVYEEETMYSKSCVPLLLSHLRIAIRAQHSSLATHTAFELMKVDLLALLREMISIVLEEAVPNPMFPVFLWLVCAMEKGYRPPRTLCDWLMGLIRSAATCTFQDRATSSSVTTAPIILVCKTVADLPPAKCDLLYAIQLAKTQLPPAKKPYLDTLTRMWITRMSPSDPHGTVYSRSCSNVPHASSANWALEYDAWHPAAVTPQCTDIVDQIRQHDMSPAHSRKWPDDTVIKLAFARYAGVKNTRYWIATGTRDNGDDDVSPAGRRGQQADEADTFWWHYVPVHKMDEEHDEDLFGSDDERMDLDELDRKLMKDDLADEDDELRLDEADTELWLVKVPNFLAEKWAEVAADDLELGTVEVPILPAGQDPHRNTARIRLPEQPWAAEMPKDYTLPFRPPQRGFAFTVNSNSDRPQGIVGKITREGAIAPVVDRAYKNLMAVRTKTIDMKKRSIQKHDPKVDGQTHSHTFIKPINNVVKDPRSFGLNKKTPQQDKKERLDKQDLINLIFTAFEKYAHWNFKGLADRTQQPLAWLKEVLNEVAVLNRRGPYVGLYELKPEFKGSTGGAVTAENAPDTQEGASSSNAPNEGGGEEDDGDGAEDFEIL
ncbi:hypothetical protein HDU86_003068 [Geranomyces michiganensis]|nr:hypothetical protein HDU86_003068 [Geranomyces michiganensis]